MTEQIKKQPLLSWLMILFLVAMIFANIGGDSRLVKVQTFKSC